MDHRYRCSNSLDIAGFFPCLGSITILKLLSPMKYLLGPFGCSPLVFGLRRKAKARRPISIFQTHVLHPDFGLRPRVFWRNQSFDQSNVSTGQNFARSQFEWQQLQLERFILAIKMSSPWQIAEQTRAVLQLHQQRVPWQSTEIRQFEWQQLQLERFILAIKMSSPWQIAEQTRAVLQLHQQRVPWQSTEIRDTLCRIVYEEKAHLSLRSESKSVWGAVVNKLK
eukprot:scaffold896_cov250-Pinguiococcus_pyrenoidosus.AAC.1